MKIIIDYIFTAFIPKPSMLQQHSYQTLTAIVMQNLKNICVLFKEIFTT